MKIGLCGTMSVGKSTLVKELSKLEYFKDYYISTERSKYLRDLGIPLNTSSTLLGQYIFMAERATELMHENVLTDRSIWDVCAFTLSSNQISEYDKRRLVESSIAMMPYYDIVIYVDPEGVDIEDNQIRETNKEYRDKIDKVINLTLYEYPPKKLIKVKGLTDNRISTIFQYL